MFAKNFISDVQQSSELASGLIYGRLDFKKIILNLRLSEMRKNDAFPSLKLRKVSLTFFDENYILITPSLKFVNFRIVHPNKNKWMKEDGGTMSMISNVQL